MPFLPDFAYANTTSSMFEDFEAIHDVEYCYVVTANYPSGESQPTNESCAMWILAAPLSVTAVGGNGYVEVDRILFSNWYNHDDCLYRHSNRNKIIRKVL